ncbi:hypothetical protein CMI40_02525 [Candidatus Pacearchaeota archaeon]|jgi:hypothetical protein|nr:hypothetical protein [Candidatus Pacearchaeota archaeon]|tara:strand:- start:19594 stop:20292 length:699 start_codon:yes stop_codon:yes gene_type:complete
MIIIDKINIKMENKVSKNRKSLLPKLVSRLFIIGLALKLSMDIGIENYYPTIKENTPIIKEKKIKKKQLIEKPIERKPLTEKELYSVINSAQKKVRGMPEYINSNFIKTLVYVESTNKPCETSKKGAKGLGQLLPGTWNQHEKNISYEDGVCIPEKNLEVVLKHLKWQEGYFKNKYLGWEDVSENKRLILQAAGYNGGMARLRSRRWDVNRMFSETRKYVKKIKKEYSRFNS